MDFADCCGCIGRVMQDSVRVDNVERVVREVEVFGIGDAESAGQLKEFEAAFCQIDCCFSEIDSGVVGASLGELSAIGSESATDFQDVQIFRLCKTGSGGDVPLFTITMLFYEFVEPA